MAQPSVPRCLRTETDDFCEAKSRESVARSLQFWRKQGLSDAAAAQLALAEAMQQAADKQTRKATT